MSNRLAHETSPYLLQHKDNPVDWFPWGTEALQRARAEDKPIFLSIGYSACHWCHVMEHESFESEEIARQLNESFVSIKVDREERPDLDQIYMNAVQMMTGRGGWPMSMFLTPSLEPFYGGTYWPPSQRMEMPGFDQVLAAVNDAWQNRREQALETAGELTQQLRAVGGAAGGGGEPSAELLDGAAAKLERAFDFRQGGFGGAPKFPHPMNLGVLLRYWFHHRRDGVLDMVRLTLDKMAAGGIYDHLGGGFARYSVDDRWLVPHFEKMLYDNALLTAAYTEGYLVAREEGDGSESHPTGTGDGSESHPTARNYARVVRETLDYILREMTDPAGGFYSTLDADSEGEEGKFYVWTPQEVKEILGQEPAETFARVYDVTEQGNFEGKNILNLPHTIEQQAKMLGVEVEQLRSELAESRQKLLAARSNRVWPGLDDKIIVAWNGLMIDSMARAGCVLDEPRYVAGARKAAEFLLTELRGDDGRLLHTWRAGKAKLDAYLDDYAALANALVSVYEATFDERYIDEAVQHADVMLERFRDADGGGFFYTAEGSENLIARNKDLHDGSIPSGNALAATGLLRLGKLTGRQEYLEAAIETLQAASGVMQSSPLAAGQMLIALDMHLRPMHEIVVLTANGKDATEVLRGLWRQFIPNKVVAARRDEVHDHRSPHLDPLLAGKTNPSDEPTVYVCRNFTCQAPVVGTEAINQLWEQLASGSA